MPDGTTWLIAAMLALGALAMGLLLYLGSVRLPMIFSGEVKVRDIALDRMGWPDRERRVSNAFDNQFQLPVLFYAGCAIALYLGAGWLEVLLGWAFVASRYVHAYIHVTDNHVIRRFTAYVTGLGLLIVLWIDLAVRLVLSATGA